MDELVDEGLLHQRCSDIFRREKTGSKPGGPFTRVDKSTYTLADPAAHAASEQAGPEKPAAKPKPRPRKRQQETPAA